MHGIRTWGICERTNEAIFQTTECSGIRMLSGCRGSHQVVQIVAGLNKELKAHGTEQAVIFVDDIDQPFHDLVGQPVSLARLVKDEQRLVKLLADLLDPLLGKVTMTCTCDISANDADLSHMIDCHPIDVVATDALEKQPAAQDKVGRAVAGHRKQQRF
jgi:hypothetical protein